MKDPGHILITGASSGIGAALAEVYAQEHVTLSLHGRDEKRLATVASKAQQKGATTATQCGDVTNASELAKWIETRHTARPLDLVIANAAISAGAGLGDLEDENQSRAIFATNLDGVLNTAYPAIQLMLARKRGQIAIVSSVASYRGFPGAASYCASKAAIRTLGESWRCDLRRFGIDVNVICPGFIRTPMTSNNPYPMPWIMSAERAATIIRKSLGLNHPRIAFPWRMIALIECLNFLPRDLSDKLLMQFPRKQASTESQQNRAQTTACEISRKRL